MYRWMGQPVLLSLVDDDGNDDDDSLCVCSSKGYHSLCKRQGASGTRFSKVGYILCFAFCLQNV